MDLIKEGHDFRDAIIEVRYDRGFFSMRDRMYNFPGGCCDDTCDLFGYYLRERYGIDSQQLVKIYAPNDPEERRNHAVLLLEDNTIIDLTGDQIRGGCPVYVGKENSFYNAMEFERIQNNYDIEQDDRLWADYQAIMNKLGH